MAFEWRTQQPRRCAHFAQLGTAHRVPPPWDRHRPLEIAPFKQPACWQRAPPPCDLQKPRDCTGRQQPLAPQSFSPLCTTHFSISGAATSRTHPDTAQEVADKAERWSGAATASGRLLRLFTAGGNAWASFWNSSIVLLFAVYSWRCLLNATRAARGSICDDADWFGRVCCTLALGTRHGPVAMCWSLATMGERCGEMVAGPAPLPAVSFNAVAGWTENDAVGCGVQSPSPPIVRLSRSRLEEVRSIETLRWTAFCCSGCCEPSNTRLAAATAAQSASSGLCCVSGGAGFSSSRIFIAPYAACEKDNAHDAVFVRLSTSSEWVNGARACMLTVSKKTRCDSNEIHESSHIFGFMLASEQKTWDL